MLDLRTLCLLCLLLEKLISGPNLDTAHYCLCVILYLELAHFVLRVLFVVLYLLKGTFSDKMRLYYVNCTMERPHSGGADILFTNAIKGIGRYKVCQPKQSSVVLLLTKLFLMFTHCSLQQLRALNALLAGNEVGQSPDLIPDSREVC